VYRTARTTRLSWIDLLRDVERLGEPVGATAPPPGALPPHSPPTASANLMEAEAAHAHGYPGRAEGVGAGEEIGLGAGFGVIGPRPGTPYSNSPIALTGADCDPEMVTPTVAAPSAMVIAATKTRSVSVRCCISNSDPSPTFYERRVPKPLRSEARSQWLACAGAMVSRTAPSRSTLRAGNTRNWFGPVTIGGPLIYGFALTSGRRLLGVGRVARDRVRARGDRRIDGAVPLSPQECSHTDPFA
jgi:hypothetical protein